MKKRRLRLKMPITEARIAKATDLFNALELKCADGTANLYRN